MALRIALRSFLYGAFLLAAAAAVIIAWPRAAVAEQTITVYVHDSHGPVSGAIVHMAGLQDVATGSDGIAVFHPPYSGLTMYVRVRAASHKTKTVFVSSPNVDVFMSEIIATRTLTVVVKGRYPTGIHPLPGARITVSGARVRWSGETNAEGVFETQHADTIGDELKITAHMGGFEDQTKRITVGAVGLSVTSTADNAAFLLEREKSGEVSLIVEVLNHDNDKPISGAQVSLGLVPGRSFMGVHFTRQVTDAKGEAHFTEQHAIPKKWIGEGLKVTVHHSDYQVRTEDIAAELFSGEAPRYLVYLKPKHQPSAFDLSGDWTLTWTFSVTSVDFVGKVSGGGKSFSFSGGSVAGGGNALWTTKKDEGQVTCTATATSKTAGHIHCSASFSGAHASTWNGDANGDFAIINYAGHKKKFELLGRYGKGTTVPGEGHPVGIDTLELKPKL